MRTRLPLLLGWLVLGCLWIVGAVVGPIPTARAEDDPTAAASRHLAALVALPTPDARRARADALAKEKGIDLDAWLAAMRAFGSFRRVASGIDHATEMMHTGTRLEAIEISVYVPSTYAATKPAPLLLALHGSGGGARDLPGSWRATAEALGMIVVAPTDPDGIGGWTKTAAERRRAFAAVRWARRAFNIDEARIHCTGISRGGHLTWDLGLRHPDRFATLAPMIGGPLVGLAGGRNNLRFIENLVHVPLRDLQGARDDARLVANLRLAFARLKHYKADDAVLHEFPQLGHSFDLGAVDWKAFLGESRRPAVPPRVIRRTVHVKGERADEGRAFWVEILDTKKPSIEMPPLRVDPRQWNKMTDDAKRAFQAVEAEKATARLEARMPEPGAFVLKTTGVKRMRLLLTRAMLGDGTKIEIVLNGRKRSVKPKPDARLLLREFAERFDRTFLPVAEVVLKP